MESIDIEDFTGVLVGDVEKCRLRVVAEDTQPNRRNLVRAVFAAIEGLVWQLKNELANSLKSTLTPNELAAIKEENFSVTGTGKIEIGQRFMPLSTSLRLIIAIICRLRPNYTVEFGHRGWSNLQHAIDVRNRLVHPKKLSDLEVRDIDLEKSMSGFYWILARNIEVLRETVALVKDDTKLAENFVALLTRKNRKKSKR